MNFSMLWILLILVIVFVVTSNGKAVKKSRSSISIGPCTWVIDRKCPDIDIQFYLFTRKNVQDRQNVYIDETLEKSNLSSSHFNALYPTKIIIHGYNADMFLHPLIEMKDEYLQRDDYNLFFVDWSTLASGPCYFSAVHNARHTGACIGQLIERILERGSSNIHLIGFSLGAQVTNFVAQSLGSFVIPRITGLDPAMPLFITASKENKLDASDAAFVDVIHTNAFVQGKIERCGHVDFYMNGGIIQPGCTSGGENPFACSHHRAPDYFAESIRSYKGFWGWACSSYINYLLGNCPPTNYLVLAGEDCKNTNGMFLVTTDDKTPFALGKWTDNIKKSEYNGVKLSSPMRKHNLLIEHIDQWGKLDSSFNNIVNFPTPIPQDLQNGNWPYFGMEGPNEITAVLKSNQDSTTNGDAIQMIKDHRTPPKIKRRRKPTTNPVQKEQTPNILQLYNEEIQKRQNFLQSYKKNLTVGVIDSEIFQYPVLEKY